MDYYERPLWVRYMQGVLFAGAVMALFSKDTSRGTYLFVGIMGGMGAIIEAYYYFKKK